MAAQGQSIFVASGDRGAYDDADRPSTLEVDDPASQPYVTAVGGTTLFANASTGEYVSETSWGTSSLGGGGGVSSIWSQPSWQANLSTAANRGSVSMRMVPDVSLDSNPSTGYPVFTRGAWYAIGGTSAAAPLWAAFAAIVNQGRVANGVARLGFANPALYQIGQSSAYSSSFHDIADGSTNRYYPAVQGYDLSTGWGTIKGPGLFAVLSSGVLPPSAPTSISLIAGPSSLTVSWSGGNGASAYKIFRADSANGPFSQIGTVNAPATTFVDGTASGVNFYYVKATNTSGESAASPMESGAAGQRAPSAPTGLAGVLQ